ncbi:DUF2231 domain-containing protein [Candidatus Phyllobacterium onerii]|uniref:DUF2231 domain-containing protein n=1 Tax=Candidatus Phyllobacterium onerii TaxID=3020828 RepID=UPI00232DB2BB|nr:DUF2231 domain-containing protein [Phyllobacterium sp. IY22]
MPHVHPRATASIAGIPIRALLAPFPIVCFIGALLTDITYAQTTEMMWADFSAWLVTVGLIMGVLAFIAGLIDFVGDPAVRRQRSVRVHLVGSVILLVLAALNMFIHTHDAWTSVVPWGLTLSAIIVVVLLVTEWMGFWMVFHHSVGVSE